MKIIDQLAEEIRTGKVTPTDALSELQAGGVLVWAADEEPTTWGQVEDRGASTSGLYHALAAVDASALADQFSKAVAEQRAAGRVVPV